MSESFWDFFHSSCLTACVSAHIQIACIQVPSFKFTILTEISFAIILKDWKTCVWMWLMWIGKNYFITFHVYVLNAMKKNILQCLLWTFMITCTDEPQCVMQFCAGCVPKRNNYPLRKSPAYQILFLTSMTTFFLSPNLYASHNKVFLGGGWDGGGGGGRIPSVTKWEYTIITCPGFVKKVSC